MCSVHGGQYSLRHAIVAILTKEFSRGELLVHIPVRVIERVRGALLYVKLSTI